MSNLPFLKPRVWPKERKLSGISKYGFSEDDELIESALNELMQAIESKDYKQLTESLKALIDCILAKEQKGEGDAANPLEEASGV